MIVHARYFGFDQRFNKWWIPMKKCKVLTVSTVELSMGGITTVIMNYYKNINKKEVQMDFVVNRKIEACFEEIIKKNHSQIYILIRNKNPLKYIFQLSAIIKENNYEVIHVHGNSATMVVDLLAAMIGGVKIRIAHCHNTECMHRVIHKLLMPVFDLTYTKALACSVEAGKWIFGEGNFDVLPNGISVNDYRFSRKDSIEIREELHLEDKLIIGHVGYMNRQKNHLKLLGILKELKGLHKNVHLLCVTGSDQIPDKLQQLIKDYHLENEVTVFFRRNDVNRLMQGMDVFVFPSLYEGLGIALLEAQAAGLPCIASDRVPIEVDIMGRIEFCPLEESNLDWAHRILTMELPTDEERERCNNYMLHSEFDIKKSCKKIMALYGLEN